MNWASWLLWGFCGTVMLTAVMGFCRTAGLTRLDFPYLLGTMVTPNRDRAQVLGFGMHLVDGWVAALLYIGIFHALGGATWWRGALIGLAHAACVLAAGVRVLPGLHPRMASEHQGPTVSRQLEPPGAFGRNYGRHTPLAIALAHAAYGTLLGAFYDAGHP